MQGGTAGAQGCAWGSAARRRAPLPPPPPPHGCSLRAHRLLLPCCTLALLLLLLLHHLVTPATTLPPTRRPGAAVVFTRHSASCRSIGSAPAPFPPPPATPLLGRGGSEQAAQQAQGGSEVGPQPVGGLAFSPARRPAATHAASNDGAGCRWIAGEGCGEGVSLQQQGSVARWTRRLPARPHADACCLHAQAGLRKRLLAALRSGTVEEVGQLVREWKAAGRTH